MKKLMIAVCMAAMATGAFADVSFGYQGTLCDAQGTAVASATKTIVFRLYKSDTAATTEALWGRSYNVKTGANGVFNVELCDDKGSALTDGTPSTGLKGVISTCAANSEPLYVGLTVSDSSGEITPRQKMIATPYSAFALDVNAASGDFTVSGVAHLNGGVEMTSSSYLTAGNVSAQKLTCAGDVMMDSKVIAQGAVEAQQDLAVGGKLTVTGATALNGGATVTGDLTATGKIKDQGGEVGVPIGTIVMWSGSSSSLPTGWKVCNGDGTYTDPYSNTIRNIPDLRNRFIVGAGSKYSVSDNGGYESVTLDSSHIPSHNHSVSLSETLDEVGLDLSKDNVFIATTAYNWLYKTKDGYLNEKASTHTMSGNTGNAGGGSAHENRPPYYALYYIIKVGSN